LEGKILEVLGEHVLSADALKRETLWTGTDEELVDLLQDMAGRKLVELKHLGALAGGRKLLIRRLYVRKRNGR